MRRGGGRDFNPSLPLLPSIFFNPPVTSLLSHFLPPSSFPSLILSSLHFPSLPFPPVPLPLHGERTTLKSEKSNSDGSTVYGRLTRPNSTPKSIIFVCNQQFRNFSCAFRFYFLFLLFIVLNKCKYKAIPSFPLPTKSILQNRTSTSVLIQVVQLYCCEGAVHRAGLSLISVMLLIKPSRVDIFSLIDSLLLFSPTGSLL